MSKRIILYCVSVLTGTTFSDMTMILTGRWMALVNHFFLEKFNHIYNSSYIKIFDDKDDEAVAA